MRRTILRAVTAVVATAFFASGCSTDTADEPDSTTLGLNWGVSYQWSADPGVDLDSPGARVVRAAVESTEIAWSIGSIHTYPGFREAIGDHGLGGSDEPRGAVGTVPIKLIIRSEAANGIDAIVCIDETLSASDVYGRFPLPDSSMHDWLSTFRVTARRDQRRPAPTTEPLSSSPLRVPIPSVSVPGPSGRQARPSGNVFGDWTFDEFDFDWEEANRRECESWAQQRWGGPTPPSPTRTEDDLPAVEPFRPGWES